MCNTSVLELPCPLGVLIVEYPNYVSYQDAVSAGMEFLETAKIPVQHVTLYYKFRHIIVNDDSCNTD